MENFFIDEEFYSDLGVYIDTLDDEEFEALEDDWSIVATESSLEPIFQLTADWIIDMVPEERFSEDGDEYERVQAALSKIDYAAVNAAIPKMYYGTKKEFTITKADLLEYLK